MIAWRLRRSETKYNEYAVVRLPTSCKKSAAVEWAPRQFCVKRAYHNGFVGQDFDRRDANWARQLLNL